jgi:hypothetical protein
MSTIPDPLSANVRRGPSGQLHQNVFDETPWGYLAVYVEFLGEPVKGLRLKFYEEDGGVLGPRRTPVETNDKGIYAGGRIRVGRYLCQIENQKRLARITSVEDEDKPYWIVLPVGRPYFDIAVDAKFDAFRNNS